MSSKRPPKDQLEQLYIQEQQTTGQIGRRFGVSATTAHRWLKHYNIPIRSNFTAQHLLRGREIIEKPPCSDLKTLYEVEVLSYKEIGRRYNVSNVTAKNWCKACGIETRDASVTQRITANRFDAPDAEELAYLYLERGYTQHEVALHYGVSWITVKKWQRAFEIPRRSGPRPKPRPSKDELRSLYSERQYPLEWIGRIYGVCHSTVAKWLRQEGIPVRTSVRSHGEIELLERLNEIDGSFHPSQDVLEGLEVDGFDENHRLAIEYNGLYWHSDEQRHPRHLLQKLELAESKGLRLIHVFENEWREHPEIVLSIIRGYMGLHHRIGARSCQIIELDDALYGSFLERNHIQGYAPASVRLGLQHNDRIVAVLGMMHARFQEEGWEIIRFCSILNTVVNGGFARLFRYFIKQHQPEHIVTYADRRYFSGGVYEKVGFERVGTSQPNYFYFKRNETKLYSRIGFQKHKLKDRLERFDPTRSEAENMAANGWLRIWDCGNHVLKWTKEKGG